VHDPTGTDHTIKSEKIDSYTGQLEASSCDRWEIGVNCADDEAGSVSDQKQLFHWVDDYKCSICGIELPPSFIEERQEHSDFHLAEKLQGEESGNHRRSFISQQRAAQRGHTGSSSRQKKKQKSSPTASKYVPIDAFFVKTNQNF
ncbi:hypothetical protein HAX54_009769, partial [Datura stramonium]|nr:hypothetical protein [Datura stramonium]